MIVIEVHQFYWPRDCYLYAPGGRTVTVFGYGLLSSAKTSQQKEIRKEKDTERRNGDSQIDRLRHRDRQTRRDRHRHTETVRQAERGGGGKRYRQADRKTEQSGQRDGVSEQRDGVSAEREAKIVRVYTSLLNVQWGVPPNPPSFKLIHSVPG